GRSAGGAAAARRQPASGRDRALSARRLLRLPASRARDLRDARAPPLTKKENRMRISSIVLLTLCLAACDERAAAPPLPTGDFAVVTTSGGFGAGGAVNTIRLSDHMV